MPMVNASVDSMVLVSFPDLDSSPSPGRLRSLLIDKTYVHSLQ
jgi:hypothetical protein